MMAGWLRPAIYLPSAAENFDPERLKNILRHELAHVRYQDAPALWLTSLACALHWWNPLIWIAAHCFRQVQEEACDEAVLSQGADPLGYAQDLLSAVKLLRSALPSNAIAMVRSSNLRRRIQLILDESRVRGSLSIWSASGLMIFGSIMSVACLAVGLKAENVPPETQHKFIGISVQIFRFHRSQEAMVRKTAGLSE